MGDKIRGSIALLVGLFAIVQGGLRMYAGDMRWQIVLEVVAGLVLTALGIWRIRRKPDEPTEELLK
jgi:type IV secretory pathway VirB2 component (pilin)